MSCFVVGYKSLEALYLSLLAHTGYGAPLGCVTLPKEGWADFVWEISKANSVAYNYRYEHLKGEDESVGGPHELKKEYGSLEIFKAAMHSPLKKQQPLRTPAGTIKLLNCLAYQIIDAPNKSKAYKMAGRLNRMAAEMALNYVGNSKEYDAAPWG